jgi:hypothetical protein
MGSVCSRDGANAGVAPAATDAGQQASTTSTAVNSTDKPPSTATHGGGGSTVISKSQSRRESERRGLRCVVAKAGGCSGRADSLSNDYPPGGAWPVVVTSVAVAFAYVFVCPCFLYCIWKQALMRPGTVPCGWREQLPALPRGVRIAEPLPQGNCCAERSALRFEDSIQLMCVGFCGSCADGPRQQARGAGLRHRTSSTLLSCLASCLKRGEAIVVRTSRVPRSTPAPRAV